MLKRVLTLALLVLAGCSFDVPSEPPPAHAPYCTFSDPVSLEGLAPRLAELPAREKPLDGYDRNAWGRWSDFDDDCQNTRAEILIAESRSSVFFSDPSRPCLVVSGRWEDPYSLQSYEFGSSLDIDHVIALRTLFDIVGHNPRDRYEALDFELDFIEHENLLAVSRRANRSKGSRGPDKWLPEPVAARCAYVRRYANLLVSYTDCYGGGTLTQEGIQTLVHQAKLCAAGGVPGAPQLDNSYDIDPPDSCCKVCRVSTACGDSCISRAKVCTKPPGCACQGVPR